MAAETRARLLQLARAAFGGRGYAETSLDELTIAAGVTRGALYHHFRHKTALFEAVVDEIDEELHQAVDAAGVDAGGGWTGFRAGCLRYLRLLEPLSIRRIYLIDAPSVIDGFAVRPKLRLCTAAMVRTLSSLAADGEIQQINPEALANGIVGFVNQMAGWASVHEDPHAAFQIAQTTVDQLLDGVTFDRSKRTPDTAPRTRQPKAAQGSDG